MMKFLILAVVLVALAQPSTQLKCYNCRDENFVSKKSEFNDLPQCNKDKFEDSNKKELPGTSLEKCLKVIEKVNDKSYVVRTVGQENDLDPKTFEIYSCNTDLCNSGVTAAATFLAVLLPAVLVLPQRF